MAPTAPVPNSAAASVGLSDHHQDGVLDEHRVEEQVAYRQRMNRWSRETMVALSDHLFWPLIHLNKWSCGPEEHFRRFMQSHISLATLDLRGGHLQQLVVA